MPQALVRPSLGWEIASREEPNPEPHRSHKPGTVYASMSSQSPCDGQSAELRHDMANILSILQLRLSALKRVHMLSDDETAVLDQCMVRLRDLLDCWRQLEANSASQTDEQGEFFDLCKVAAQIIQIYRPVINERNQRLNLSFQPGPRAISGSRILYERLIDNLISNASKYTPSGGQLEVNIQICAAQIRLEVSDTGIGMSQNEIERVFDRYYRTEAAQLHTAAGNGLGLHIVKEIVDRLGGEITVHSQVGHGSTFIVTLPNDLSDDEVNDFC
jgi:two-component system, OmpR family, phosphate regulon sensor histidine kinase PhoR